MSEGTAEIWVNMNDKFMSGWGCASKGRSILCVRCDTRAQADAIEKAAHDRGEMRYIVTSNKPRRGRRGDRVSYRSFSDMGGPWLKYYSGEDMSAADGQLIKAKIFSPA